MQATFAVVCGCLVLVLGAAGGLRRIADRPVGAPLSWLFPISATIVDGLGLLALYGGPQNQAHWWPILELLHLTLAVGLTTIVYRTHLRANQLSGDAWELSGWTTLVLWTTLLATVPGASTGSFPIEFFALSTALWVAAVALFVMPGDRRAGSESADIKVLWEFLTLRAVAALLIFLGAQTDNGALTYPAGVLLVLAHAALALGPGAGGLISAFGRNEGLTRLIPQPVPSAISGIGGTVVVVLIAVSPPVREPWVFGLLILNLLVNVTNQALTSTMNLRLFDRLSQRERYFRHLVRDSADVIAICSPAGIIEYLSPAAANVIGVDAEHAVGRPLATVIGAPRGVVTSSGGGTSSIESSITTPTATIHLETILSVNDRRLICNIRDVTERVALREQLHAMAYTDQLSGLPNRPRILELVTTAMADAGGAGSAVLFIDLDGFKRVNDAAGHAVGDEILREVGHRIAEYLPSDCAAGRLGGDEFVVVIPDVRTVVPEGLAANLIDLIRRPFVTHHGNFAVGASIGIGYQRGGGPQGPGWRPVVGSASVADDIPGNVSASDLLRNADLAAYDAKRNRSGWRVFQPAMLRIAMASAELEAELEQALRQDHLLLLFQPIIDLRTDTVSGAEALLRWRSADGAINTPGTMLDYARRSGFAHGMTMRILHSALAACATWPANLGVSVNLSPEELLVPSLVADVRASLRANEVDPGRLTLEITEDTLLSEPGFARDVIGYLRQTGVRISVDDFGTGYSSMSYLLDLQLDELKIDRSVVGRLGEGSHAHGVVAGIVQLATTLNLTVIAEGVETREQALEVGSVGCHFAQGFRFSGPLSAVEFAEYAVRGRELKGV